MRRYARWIGLVVLAVAIGSLAACGGSDTPARVHLGDECKHEAASAISDEDGQMLRCNNVAGGLHWGIDAAAPQASPSIASEPQPLLQSLPIDVHKVNFAKVLKQRATYSNYEMRTFPLLVFGLDEAKGGQRDPQPGFYAPLGTDVLAPVTSTVVEVKVLEHGDWTIMYAPAEKGYDYWETEHVIKVAVEVGDQVTAGQPVGKVSDVDCHLSKSYCKTGLGLVELGLLKGNSFTPTHFCPFLDAYVDPAHRDKVLGDYTWALDQAEKARGKRYMARTTWQSPYCMVTAPVTE